MKRVAALLLMLAAAGPALAQPQSVKLDLAPPDSATTIKSAPGAPKPSVTQAPPPAPPPAPSGPMTLLMRGLDKITGKPTDIIAPIGKTVQFFTLSITARTCYSTPPSETPETTAFVQIQDHRPDQTERRVFSGWMYASSPGLNGMEHPLYDVWVISCRGGADVPTTVAASAPVKVASPDSSDKEQAPELPAGAGQ